VEIGGLKAEGPPAVSFNKKTTPQMKLVLDNCWVGGVLEDDGATETPRDRYLGMIG
jgi:hypothetical protein